MTAKSSRLAMMTLVMLGSLGLARPAAAQAIEMGTVFLGVTMPASRPAFGFAFGKTPAPVGFEVEYAHPLSRPSPGQSVLSTVAITVLVKTPVRVGAATVYGAGGFGIAGESLDGGKGSLNTASNFGAGLTVPLAGPMALRLDWRFFHIGSSPDGAPSHANVQRFSAGVSFGF
jgi:opacity protein-like surface antigen